MTATHVIICKGGHEICDAAVEHGKIMSVNDFSNWRFPQMQAVFKPGGFFPKCSQCGKRMRKPLQIGALYYFRRDK